MTAARYTWAIYVLFHVCVTLCAHGGELRDGVLTVTLANGTQTALKYQVPKGQQYTAPGPSGAAGADAVCCVPLVGEVAWYDSFRYSLYSTPNCQPSSRVCNIPGKVQSAWVCGCSGGDCSGEHTITAQTPVLTAPADAVATLSEVSTQQLHKHQGMPTRITVFLASQPGSMAGTDGAGECALQGFKVEYVQGAAAIGPTGASQSKVVLGTGLKKDPVVAVLFQKQGSCVSYLMMRTRSGRSAQAGSMNPALELHTASAPAGSEGLAALHGFTRQQDTTAPGAPAGALQSLNLLWGVSQCSAHASGIRRAKATAQETLPVQTGGAQAATSATPGDAAGASVKQGLGRRARFAQWAPGALTAVQAAPRWRAAASAAAQAVAGRVAAVKDALDKAALAASSSPSKRPGNDTQVSIASLPRAAAAAPAPKWAPLLAQLGKQAGFSNKPAGSVHGQLRSGGQVQPTRGDPDAAAPAAQEEPSSQQTPLSGGETTQPAVAELPSEGGMQPSSSSSPDTATPAAQEAQANQQTQAPVGEIAAVGSAAMQPMAETLQSGGVQPSAPATQGEQAAQQSPLPSADSVPTGSAATQPAEQQKQTATPGGHEGAAQQGGSDALVAVAQQGAVYATKDATQSQAVAADANAGAAAAAAAPHTQESITAKPGAVYSDDLPASRSDTEGPSLVSSEHDTASSNSTTQTADVHSSGGSSSGTPAGPVTLAPTTFTTAPSTGPEPAGPDAQPRLPSQPSLDQDGSSAEASSNSSTSGGQDSTPSPSPKPRSSKGRFPSCRLSDPFCFTDEECYCQLSNGTFGAACPVYGSCLGACCATTGTCPTRMGYEDPQTGQQSVLLPSTCGDWGLNEEGMLPTPAAQAGASSLECKLPRNRECALGTAGYACMGYTACKGGDCGAVQDLGGSAAVGAMCVYKEGNSTLFDVCSCLPVY